MTETNCPMCQDQLFTQPGLEHPQKIADLDVSTAVLNRDWQFYRGSSILVFRGHVTELHHLEPDIRRMFTDDAFRMAEALDKTFMPLKIDHALFGNVVRHLHWHLIPRRETDPFPTRAIWEDEFPQSASRDEELQELADQIRRNL